MNTITNRKNGKVWLGVSKAGHRSRKPVPSMPRLNPSCMRSDRMSVMTIVSVYPSLHLECRSVVCVPVHPIHAVAFNVWIERSVRCRGS